MSTLKDQMISAQKDQEKFQKLSIKEFAKINKNHLPPKLKSEFKKSLIKKQVIVTVSKNTKGLKSKGSAQFVTKKGLIKGKSMGTTRIVGSLRSRKDLIDLRIRYEAATNSGKLHLIHNSNEWKLFPEDADISLFNAKNRRKAIAYGEKLLENDNYTALVVHNIDGDVIEYIIKR